MYSLIGYCFMNHEGFLESVTQKCFDFFQFYVVETEKLGCLVAAHVARETAFHNGTPIDGHNK